MKKYFTVLVFVCLSNICFVCNADTDNASDEIDNDLKNRIKYEEIYRETVRDELRKKSKKTWYDYLNSPFVIWLLSTVVVSGLSYLYTRRERLKKLKENNEDRLRLISEEIDFRIRQVNTVVDEAVDHSNKIKDDLNKNNGKIKGDRIDNYLEVIKKITVVARLGGLYFSPDSDDRVSIGSKGYGSRSLPFAKGHKNPQFINDSLVDLVGRAFRIAYDAKGINGLRNELVEKIKEFDDAAKISFVDIITDWRERHQAQGEYKKTYGRAYEVYNVMVDDYSKNIFDIISWVEKNKTIWNKLKKLKLLTDITNDRLI